MPKGRPPIPAGQREAEAKVAKYKDGLIFAYEFLEMIRGKLERAEAQLAEIRQNSK